MTMPVSRQMRRLAAAWPSLIVLLAGLALLQVEPRIVEANDERLYHLPSIQSFAAQLPFPGIRDYRSATTPLYHLIMAVPLRAGVDLWGLRVLSLVLSALGVAAIQWFFAGFTTPRRAAVCAATIGLSPYYLGPALFLATDNLAFGLMACVLGLLVRAPERHPARVALATSAAILTRQLYVWLLPLSLFVLATRRPRWRALAWQSVPAAVFIGLWMLWGGPVPPSFQFHQQSRGLLPLIVIVATFGVWAAPLLPALAAGAHRRRALILFALSAPAALIYLGFMPITPDHPAAWGGGMRRLGAYTGAIAGTSAVFWLGLLLGLAAMALMLSRSLSRSERLALTALAFWTVAQQANAAMMERYYQPFVLLVLLVFAAGGPDRRMRIGSAILIAMVLAASAVRFLLHGTGLFRF